MQKINELFTPYKTTRDLVCEHCGEIIPTATYFEEFRKKPYHIECLWDKLINKKSSNTYNEAEKFFYSLKTHIGDWFPYGYDTEETYISDLELVESNNRFLHRVPFEENFISIAKQLGEELGK